jgi:phosphoethanolamine N-methyltransferase
MLFIGNNETFFFKKKRYSNLIRFSSRDVGIHVSDKTTLFNNFYTWLKEDGHLLITDFCCGNTPFSQDLLDYARSGMYTLRSIQEYTEVIEKEN